MKQTWGEKEAAGLLNWYQKEKIVYPWTGETDGYRVLVSELMLQQTVAATVIPKYSAWLSRFPDFSSLAKADEETVLRLWEGLGYYARAKNLRKIAVIIDRDYHGGLPDTEEELRKLPGIGTYTASALLSFVHKKKTAVFDANVRRIFCRLEAKEEPGNTAEARIRKMLTDSIPEGKSPDFNSALMQFGQKTCLSRSPLCKECLLKPRCKAAEKNMQNLFPAPKKTETIRLSSRLLLCKKGEKILVCRGKKGRFSHQWRFPRMPEPEVTATVKSDTQTCIDGNGMTLKGFGSYTEKAGAITEPFVHAYTKYAETLYPRFVEEEAIPYGETEDYRWANVSELEELAFPSCYRKLTRKLSSLLT
jgi:A/G-specific adenine glycosylase